MQDSREQPCQFLLNGKEYKLPSHFQNQEEGETELFNAIQTTVPSIKDLPLDIEDELPFTQENALGVREKGIIVVSPDQGKYQIAGTDGLHTCIGMSFYSPSTKKLVIVHFDGQPGTKIIEAALKQFEPGEKVEVRVFGGMSPGKYDSSGMNIESLKRAKEIFWALYHSNRVTLDFRSADIFTTLHDYRRACYKQKVSTDVGFAINSANNKVFVRPCPALNDEPSPYGINVDHCGLFSGPYKDGHVNVAFLKNIKPHGTYFKHYDAFIEHWEEKYRGKLEALSQDGLVSILFNSAKQKSKCIDSCSVMCNGLRRYIKANLVTWCESYATENFTWHELLLNKCAIDEKNKKPHYDNWLKGMGFELKETPIDHITSSDILAHWCRSSCRFYIPALIKSIRDANDLVTDKDFYHTLDACLSTINGSRELLKTFIRFEKSLAYKQYAGTQEETLITQLTSCNTQDVSVIISEWRTNEIQKSISQFAKAVFNLIKPQYLSLKDSKEGFILFLKALLQNVLYENDTVLEEINLDNLSVTHNGMKELINDVVKIMMNHINTDPSMKSLLLCCVPYAMTDLFYVTEMNVALKDRMEQWKNEFLLEKEKLLVLDHEEMSSFLDADIYGHHQQDSNLDDEGKGKEKVKEKKDNEGETKKKKEIEKEKEQPEKESEHKDLEKEKDNMQEEDLPKPGRRF